MAVIKQTITAKEASDFLGISYWLVLELSKRREIPHIRAGKRVLFRKEALLAWMKEQEDSFSHSEEESNLQGTLRKIEP